VFGECGATNEDDLASTARPVLGMISEVDFNWAVFEALTNEASGTTP